VLLGPWHPSGTARLSSGGVGVGWRTWVHRRSTAWHGPSPDTAQLSWIGEERIAVGNLPTGPSLARLPEQGVTHVVNCRARPQTWVSQDLAAERSLFGRARVRHAPMRDSGRPQPPRLWSRAALFAAAALDDDPDARVLIHCHQGRRRSVLLAYAVLRLRGHERDAAAGLILSHRREAVLVPAYLASVEQWLAMPARPAA
jgi:protein-tyrosine phosphatase